MTTGHNPLFPSTTFMFAAWALVYSASATNDNIVDGSSNICVRNTIIGHAIIDAVNLSWPGLEPVKSAAVAGDLGSACEALAAYYKHSNRSAWLRLPLTPTPSERRAGGDVDDLVDHDIFRLSGVRQVAKIPRNADGGLNWLDKGPKHDPEFMNCLNRHESFTLLLRAWNATGNPIYVQYFSDLVQDWVGHLPCRKGVSRSRWNATGGSEACATGTMESPWRVLEAGIRTAGPWPPAFFGIQQADAFTTSARVMMILGFSEHNAVLNGPGRSAHTPNWAIGQWAGLVESCVALPELNNCSTLLETAFGELKYWLDKQVYPDGVETEEAFGYDLWTARSFFDTIELLHKANHAPPPASYVSKVERMFDYGVYANDQVGHMPITHAYTHACNHSYIHPCLLSLLHTLTLAFIHTLILTFTHAPSSHSTSLSLIVPLPHTPSSHSTSQYPSYHSSGRAVFPLETETWTWGNKGGINQR